jgi:hypothetical protein
LLDIVREGLPRVGLNKQKTTAASLQDDGWQLAVPKRRALSALALNSRKKRLSISKESRLQWISTGPGAVICVSAYPVVKDAARDAVLGVDLPVRGKCFFGDYSAPD